MQDAGLFDHHDNQFYIVSPPLAGNVAQEFLGPVAEGFCWYVERVSHHIASTAVLELAVSGNSDLPASALWDRGNRQDWFATATEAQHDYNQPIYVGPGQYLIAFWSAGTNADRGVVSLQIRIHRLSLMIESAEEMRQQVEPTPDITGEPEVEPAQVASDDRVLAAAQSVTESALNAVGKVI